MLLPVDVPESWVAAAVAFGPAVQTQGRHVVGAGKNRNLVERTVLPRGPCPRRTRHQHSQVGWHDATLAQPWSTDVAQLGLAARRRLLRSTRLFCVLAAANALHAARGDPNHVPMPRCGGSVIRACKCAVATARRCRSSPASVCRFSQWRKREAAAEALCITQQRAGVVARQRPPERRVSRQRGRLVGAVADALTVAAVEKGGSRRRCRRGGQQRHVDAGCRANYTTRKK